MILFHWKHFYQDGAPIAVGAGETVVAASELEEVLKRSKLLRRRNATMKPNIAVRTLGNTSFWLDAHPRLNRMLQILWQVSPPLLYFAFVFGSWNLLISAGLFLITCYCVARVLYLMLRRRLNSLLRPLVAIGLCIAYFDLANYYMAAAINSLQISAKQLQSDCKANNVCNVTDGRWVRDPTDSEKYWITFPGVISLRARLLLIEDDSHHRTCCTNPRSLTKPEAPVVRSGPDGFIIAFPWEDSLVATGGVRQSLQLYRPR